MPRAEFSSLMSVIALAVSLFTFWFTAMRRGTLHAPLLRGISV
jgi:hypothetical protein